MWRAFDAGEIGDDFARIAGLGFDAVRVLVRWDELQPERDAVDATVLDRVARIVELAATAGLRTLPALAGVLGDEATMPSWAGPFLDLYRGPLLDAQLIIGRAVAERLGGNANVVAWDVGNEFARVRPPLRGKVTAGEHASAPAAEFDVAEWSRVLAKALRAGGIAATAGASDGDLIADTNIRLGSLCAPLAFASLTSTHGTPPFARTRFDPEAVPFLAMLAAAFSFKPVLVSAVGAAPSLDAEETAAYAAAVFDRLHADGRLGAYWSSWSDIVTADDTLTPVGAALAAFAREARALRKPNDMPMIAGTYYYRTLPDSTHTLYDAYLGFIEARRLPG
jgi:hypothetical protein